MALTIYGVVRSRAIRTFWLAEELGLTYDIVPVDWSDKGTRKADYLAINPNGRIPAIRDGDLVLWESFAINLYLAKKHGGALAPADVAEDGQMTMWSMWAITEIEKDALAVLFQSMTPEDKRDPSVLNKAIANLNGPLGVLERHLAANGGHMVGNRFTVADVNLAALLNWVRGAKEVLADKPTVAGWLKECLARPAFRKAIAITHS